MEPTENPHKVRTFLYWEFWFITRHVYRRWEAAQEITEHAFRSAPPHHPLMLASSRHQDPPPHHPLQTVATVGLSAMVMAAGRQLFQVLQTFPLRLAVQVQNLMWLQWWRTPRMPSKELWSTGSMRWAHACQPHHQVYPLQPHANLQQVLRAGKVTRNSTSTQHCRHTQPGHV